MDGLVFADKFLSLVTTGDHNSTYKMATAIALMQAAQEAGPGDSCHLPTRRVAEVVVELYARQVRAGGEPLRQMNRDDQGSRILAAVKRLGSRPALTSTRQSREYESVVTAVEDALLAYPLRLLQPVDDQFLYDVLDSNRRSRLAFGLEFDGDLHLKPGVLGLLQRSAPLVRPLLEAAWVERVARYNGVVLDETALRRRLFGYERQRWPREMRAALEELQAGCFYCGGPLPRKTAELDDGSGSRTHIDHFFPWARTMNDAVENLVLADSTCNLRKSDRLPGTRLVAQWSERLRQDLEQLAQLAATMNWPYAPVRTTRSAIVLYTPFGDGRLEPAWDDGAVRRADLRPALYALRELQDLLTGTAAR